MIDFITRLYLSIKHRANLWRIESIIGRPEDHDWQIIRKIVMRKWGRKCCNCKQAEGRIDIHHIVPLGVGGSNRLSNLRPLCLQCHKAVHPWMKV
jgi:5-methylcytosine-specific restriction endonuclease McrA